MVSYLSCSRMQLAGDNVYWSVWFAVLVISVGFILIRYFKVLDV